MSCSGGKPKSLPISSAASGFSSTSSIVELPYNNLSSVYGLSEL
jgi:hypothetical protein